MDLDLLERVKRFAIVSVVSNDELMEQLVLKGGNAIDLIYGISDRGSIDIDFSMEHDFRKEELENLRKKIEKALVTTFREEALVVFDVTLKEKPQKVDSRYQDFFWGGIG